MSIDTPLGPGAELTPEGLREATRSFLRRELPDGWMAAAEADDTATLFALRSALDYGEWCTRFGNAGFATPTWPAEYGAGLSLTPGQARYVNEVLNAYKVPRPFNIIGIGMGGPVLLQHGTEEMKHRLLRPMACNEEIWCQLFSEPGSGFRSRRAHHAGGA